MGYSVALTKRALKQLGSLDKKALLLVSSFIDQLDGCENPREIGSAKKLQGAEHGWRWRVGTYRILRVTIELFRIGHRRDVYRRL